MGHSTSSGRSETLLQRIEDLGPMDELVRVPMNVVPLREGHESQRIWWRVKAKDRKRLPIEEVPTEEIYTWQRRVSKAGLKRLVTDQTYEPSSDLPMAVRMNGKVILMDGNHRVTLEVLKRAKRVKIRVYNA